MNMCRHLPIFPSRHQLSIFGVCELNFCVRNGNRWFLTAISTGYIFFSFQDALSSIPSGDSWENRTPDAAVRGRSLNRLTNEPWCTIGDSNPGPTD